MRKSKNNEAHHRHVAVYKAVVVASLVLATIVIANFSEIKGAAKKFWARMEMQKQK